MISANLTNKSFENLYKYTRENLLAQLEEYNFEFARLNHAIITFIPIKLNLLSKFKLDPTNRKDARQFIRTYFPNKTVIPITVNPPLLKGELPKHVEGNKIVNVLYRLNKDNSLGETSLEKNFMDKRLKDLPSSFKFYSTVLNNRDFILGVDYLSNTSVRKIRLSSSGEIIEDLVDPVLANGNIKRVDNNNVLIIINKDRVIHYYREMKLLHFNLQ